MIHSRNKLGSIFLAAVLSIGASAGHAASVSYNFSGAVEFGALLNEAYSGQFIFDDTTLIGSGNEWIPVGSLNFNFLGSAFDQASSVALPTVAFFDGALLGLSFNVSAFNPGFAVIPGFFDISESYFAYDNGAGSAGLGSLTYSVAAVPEPEAWALLLPGLAVLGYVAHRRRKT